jgi:hypothetical protein
LLPDAVQVHWQVQQADGDAGDDEAEENHIARIQWFLHYLTSVINLYQVKMKMFPRYQNRDIPFRVLV